MALTAEFKKNKFGVGDSIRVLQKITEGKKERTQAFEGIVIGIKGHGEGKSFTVRKIGAAQIGIERIFPLNAPSIESIEVTRKGNKGVRQSKLYYTRNKHQREIELIYSRANKKSISKSKPNKAKKSKKSKKKSSSKKKAS
jgi:large subunit ribosomal protein L19